MTTKAKQVVFNQFGSPEVLKYVDFIIPEPIAGEVIIKTEAIGVNFSDTLRRRNTYFQPTSLPYVPGSEVVGEIVSVGKGVGEPYIKGARVLAILPAGGGYAEYITAITQYCVPLPPNIDAASATAIFVQGTTALLMINQLAGNLKDKSVLINGASGGVGSLLVQLAKIRGAKVFAASSTEEKLQSAKANGADILINYSDPDWLEDLIKFNNGRGVNIAFEMVGGAVYNQTIKALVSGGHLIVYGCASGIQGNIHPEYFVDENISQSGFNLAWYIRNKTQEWQQALGMMIEMLTKEQIKIDTSSTFQLKDAAKAHRKLEARQTIGKVVLIP